MCEAARLEWDPPSLYDRCCRQVARSWSKCQAEINRLPSDVLFDISFKLYHSAQWPELLSVIGSLPLFCKLLAVPSRRICLHRMFQAIMDEKDFSVSQTLADHFFELANDLILRREKTRETAVAKAWTDVYECEPSAVGLVDTGLALGLFMREAAWYPAAQTVLCTTLQICDSSSDEDMRLNSIEVGAAYLSALNSNCVYDEAARLLSRLLDDAQRLQAATRVTSRRLAHSLAALFVEASAHHFTMNNYETAYKYCSSACQMLPRTAPPRIKLDVLRQCVKSAILRREFKRGNFFIRRAVQYAELMFGPQHPRYSDILLDYGFYLLNVDSTDAAVQVYQKALDIRKAVFGVNNLKVACAREDLAYATYVQQYSAGGFDASRNHAQFAIEVLERLLPKVHLLLASAKRVLALILEEIAIDSTDADAEKQLLLQAEELHLHSLQLARSAYGEFNIQTAKHYGNLGRLYQSLKSYEAAEKMHLRAIEIKERLLGEGDYEVALSVGHLASLYNYDMNKFDEAEKLYHRSIQIGKRLFGEAYSGLEYDYRGLLRLYSKTDNQTKVDEYSHIFHEWLALRQEMQQVQSNPFNLKAGASADDCDGTLDVEMECVQSMLAPLTS